MRRKSRDPIVVALMLIGLLAIALLAYFMSAAIDAPLARTPAKPWAPPGWVSPTKPPPSSN